MDIVYEPAVSSQGQAVVSSQDQAVSDQELSEEYLIHKEKFNAQLNILIESGKIRKTIYYKEYKEIIDSLEQLSKKTKTPREYYLMRLYNVLTVRDIKRLIKNEDKESSIKYYAYNEEIFDLILSTHKNIGHGGINKTYMAINVQYENITRPMLELFVELCLACSQSKVKLKKSPFCQ